MEYIKRALEEPLRHHLGRGKSILLLGPRQTGKTTLLSRLTAEKTVTLLEPTTRQRYEKDSSLFAGEIKALKQKTVKPPLVIVDEVQKVPAMLDVAQELIDQKTAQFIFTGSSARKLKRQNVNLLPGRVVSMRIDPFTRNEYEGTSLEEKLLDGALPGIVQTLSPEDREIDLQSYVETYLEEEIRAEALVRNIGSFLRFLEFAGLESGNIINFHSLSKEIGVNHTTIASYFEILEDTLIAHRIDPITKSLTRKKLTKSSRFLIFDLGVRRLCAGEGRGPGRERLGHLLEQYVGLELIRHAHLTPGKTKIRFWRDPDGPEVDWVIEKEQKYLPIEVKWTDSPSSSDAKHLKVFLAEYREATKGFIVCRTPSPVQIDKNIQAIPWQELGQLVE